VNPWSTYVKVPLDKWTTAQVDVASGGMTIATTGLSLPGAGLPFSLNFWYNSTRTGGSGNPGRIATDWTDSLSARLLKNTDGSVTYFKPDGGTGTFTPNSSGGYNSPGSLNATLATVSAGGWTLTWHSAGSTSAQGEVDTFNSSGQLTKKAAASGEAITITYTSGQPTQVTDTEGRVINLTYNSSSDLTGVNDTASGRAWAFGYDSSGHLNSITNPAGGVTSFTNATDGDVTAITSPAGRTINIAYSSSGGPVSTLTQAGTTTSPQWSFSYSSGSTKVTDPNGHVTTYTVDNADRVTKTTDALGQSKSTTWTPDNNVASTTDVSGNVTAFTYNATTDVLQKATLPTGAATSYTYGNTTNPYVPTQVTDAQARSVSYTYDSYGQITKATDGLSAQNATSYAYQGVSGASCGAKTGELCSVTNPDGNTTSYGYDSARQLTSITPPSPLGKTSYTYDPDGNPTQVTDGRGDTTAYTWNSTAELTQAAPAGLAAASWSYDPDGNLTNTTGESGTQSLTWDALGRLAGSTDTAGLVTAYNYDTEGNLTSLVNAAGTTSYTYSAVNKPTSIADPWGGTTNLSYVSGNDTQLAKIAFPNGVSESFTYDKSGRTTSLDAATSAGTTLIKNTYAYATSAGADTGLLQTQTNTTGNTTSYGYDALDRLTSAATKSSSGASVSTYGYGYDGAGNMTSQTVNGTTTSYTYNAASQLTSQGATYDGAGNLTGGAGFTSLGYNTAGQTTTVTPSGSLLPAPLSYAGSTQNQLVQAGTSTLSSNALGIAGSADDITKAVTEYAYTPSGGLLAENAGGSTYYYLLDPLGSVLGLTGSTGSLVDQYTYTPYGQQTAVTNTVPNLFGFAGGLQVPGTSLIHFGARYYNPSMGQWTQLDLSGQSPGYAYAGDNPVNYTDPTGQNIWGDVVGGVLAVAGAAIGAAGLVSSSPVLIVVGAVIGIAALGLYIYQMECKYIGSGSMPPGLCTVLM
jgi:RHS repeat-associated protein